MADTKQPIHAILFSFPLQGHVIPATNLAIKLALKGFTITFVNTQAIHHKISKSDPTTPNDNDIFSTARKSGLDIRYYTLSDGLPLEFDGTVNHGQFNTSLLDTYPIEIQNLLQKIIPSSDPPLTCLIADTVFLWPQMIAKKFNLIYISFWTEPASVFTLYYHLDLLKQNGHYGLTDNNLEDTIDYIPGVAAIKPTDLMSYIQETDVLTVVHQIMFKSFEEVKAADFVLCNTVEEREPDAIAALQVEKPFYAIGPVSSTGFTQNSVAKSLMVESDCTKWLDGKPNASVLYVSFGSLGQVSRHDITEIATGLLLSQVSFVWALRPGIVSSDDENPLPDEFFDECGDRGLIVPWCRQIEVLSHPAIGGFLSHCGWNSVLESIWCGVPFLCFSLFTDQHTNRKLIVDDWRIGLGVGREKPVGKDEVAEKIKNLMAENVGVELKNKVMEVRKTLGNATASDGSSEKNFNRSIPFSHPPFLITDSALSVARISTIVLSIHQ